MSRVARQPRAEAWGRAPVPPPPPRATPVRLADLYTAASALTLGRLAIATVLPLYAGTPWLLRLYLLALLTDVLDGIIARRTGTCTRAGAMFDGWVDKILHVNLAWTLAATDRVPDYWLLLWFSREILQLPMFFVLLRQFRLGRAPEPATNTAGRLTAAAMAGAMVAAMCGVQAWPATWIAGVAGTLSAWSYARKYLFPVSEAPPA